MNWAQWAIPLIAVAVWVISNLVKNQQEEARRKAMRPPQPVNPDDQPLAREAPPPRENPFLEEIRRKQAERQPPPLRPQPVPVQEKPRARRPAPDRPREPEPVRSTRRPPPIPRSVPQAIIVAEPAPVPVLSPLHIVAPTASVRPSTRALQNLHVLLSKRQTLATAYLLSEVFGQPKCRKMGKR